MNTVYFNDFLNNKLPAKKSVKLLIADPPYFRVKGDFDFAWASFAAYLVDVERWAIECKRLLADNGTLFWYGSAKNIAYAQVILDKYFSLINNAVWDKGAFMSLEHWGGIRSLAPCTERVLMYGNGDDETTAAVFGIRDYVRAGIIAAKGKIVFKDVNTALMAAINGGGVASTCLSLNKKEPGMITAEMYEKLQRWCHPNLPKPYEELRAEFEANRRVWNNDFKLTEILRFSNESNTTGAIHDHDTVKPETLTRALILTCSNPGDFVFVPFAGSGTEVAMAIREGRPAVGFDIAEKNVISANRRIAAITAQPVFNF